MREALPIVWWKAVCYHYVRRTRQVTRYRNGDAFTTTQVYYERVNSHSASSAFNFSGCGIKDISKTLVNLEAFPATKIKFSKGFSFATVEAENEFEDQRGQFFQDHERRDDYMETREGLDLLNVNFKEYMISFADPDKLPWYVSHIVFWFASLFMCSWPLRALIEYKTAYVHFHVHKLFGWNYVDPSWCPGTMSRVSTMGSSELEMNIRNNYTMVPSYSEALLMDVCSNHHTQYANGNITPNSVHGFNPYSYVTNSGLPGGTMHSPTGQPVIYVNGQVANGFVANAHVVTGNGHIGNMANGHVANGVVSNGHLPSSNAYIIENRHAQTGSLQNVSVHRTREEESDERSASRHRRRRRKRKRKRQREEEEAVARVLEEQLQQQQLHRNHQDSVETVHSEGATIHSDSEQGLSRQNSRQSESPIPSLSHSPTLVSTPESIVDIAAQSSDSQIETSRQASVDENEEPSASTSHDGHLDQSLSPIDGPSSMPNISLERQSTHDSTEALPADSGQEAVPVHNVSDIPPPYEQAVHMRIPAVVQVSPADPNTSPSRRAGRPYTLRCMETSL